MAKLPSSRGHLLRCGNLCSSPCAMIISCRVWNSCSFLSFGCPCTDRSGASAQSIEPPTRQIPPSIIRSLRIRPLQLLFNAWRHPAASLTLSKPVRIGAKAVEIKAVKMEDKSVPELSCGQSTSLKLVGSLTNQVNSSTRHKYVGKLFE